MKVYVDKIPVNCEQCTFCQYWNGQNICWLTRENVEDIETSKNEKCSLAELESVWS